MVFETWIVLVIVKVASGYIKIDTGSLRMLRLCRLARMTRLMRCMPELVTMVKGMRVASRAVGSALLMLVSLTYVFALPMYAQLKQEAGVGHHFGPLLMTMWTLMIYGTFLDSVGELLDQMLAIRAYDTVLMFMIYALLSAMTMMNMLIGILCEVVTAVAKAEKEEAAISLI